MNRRDFMLTLGAATAVAAAGGVPAAASMAIDNQTGVLISSRIDYEAVVGVLQLASANRRWRRLNVRFD